MWIRGFTAIVNQCAQTRIFENSALVIDAQNFMYDLYEKSNLNHRYGAECDLYANYLRKHLNMFKEANITCYFIFKGGTKDLQRKIVSEQQKFYKEKKDAHNINPVFMNDIHLQILDEMGFDYVFTEYEAKADCIALAKRLSCPVLSMDVEFAFSGVKYIPKNTVNFNKFKKKLYCKTISLNVLLTKLQLDKDKLAVFLLLSDEKIFLDNVFSDFFMKQRMPIQNSYERHITLLKWLSRTSIDLILKNIFDCKSVSDAMIREKLEYTKQFIDRNVKGPLVLDYKNILNRNDLTENWFEKGVALNFIAKQYIDVYRSKSLLIRDEMGHTLRPALKIVKYAYDLLTNFCNDGFDVIINYGDEKNSETIHVNDSMKKPVYLGDSCIFESGWNNISCLGLFEHFITEEINLNFDGLQTVPDDIKLLIIALVYYSRQKTDDMTKLSCSVLLSYVSLAVVKNIDKATAPGYESISTADCKLATKALDKYKYFYVRHNEIDVEMHKHLLDSMFEFQHCLKHINYLNNLCGSPLKPTIYGKTYNGTFIYNILHRMQNEEESLILEEILRSAPTVLKLVNDTINFYKKMA